MKRAASFCQLPTTDVGQISSAGRFGALRVAVALDEGQGLDRLAQAHVVGQAGAEAPAAEEGEPGVAARPGRAAACRGSPPGGGSSSNGVRPSSC